MELVDSGANVEVVKLIDCRANVAEPWEFFADPSSVNGSANKMKLS